MLASLFTHGLVRAHVLGIYVGRGPHAFRDPLTRSGDQARMHIVRATKGKGAILGSKRARHAQMEGALSDEPDRVVDETFLNVHGILNTAHNWEHTVLYRPRDRTPILA